MSDREVETVYCYPCNMTFRVQVPRYQNSVQATKCNDCGRRWWHVIRNEPTKDAVVGVWPENVESA